GAAVIDEDNFVAIDSVQPLPYPLVQLAQRLLLIVKGDDDGNLGTTLTLLVLFRSLTLLLGTLTRSAVAPVSSSVLALLPVWRRRRLVLRLWRRRLFDALGRRLDRRGRR